jgi:hypothetical protein
MISKRSLILFAIVIYSVIATPQKKFLFDATHGEMAGNGDWILDADTKDKPQRYPTPLQSTITASTVETYWTGALSSWGIALVKLGHTVETLPIGTAITYGNTSNVQDLSNYDAFIVDEPNNIFSATEKTAIMNFIKNGGGLFMISDHDNSDRDNDGYDSPAMWNDFLTNNTVKTNPFGFSIDLQNYVEVTTNALASSSKDMLIAGPQGIVSNMEIYNGTTATLNTSVNSTVKGVVWRPSSTNGGSTGVYALHAEYGSGRVVFVGDSSPADDGTGQSGNSLYTGWAEEASGDHAKLHLNGSLWLAKVTGVVTETEDFKVSPKTFELKQNYPNPFNPTTTISYQLPVASFTSLKVFDVMGNEVASLVNEIRPAGTYQISFNAQNLPSGVYIYRLNSGSVIESKKMMLLK